MKVTLRPPKVGRKRMTFTIVLAGIAAGLWIYAVSRRATPSALPLQIAAGVGIPAGVGWVTLLLMERRIIHDMCRVAWHAKPERRVREDLIQQ